jgi:hypothetical protein
VQHRTAIAVSAFLPHFRRHAAGLNAARQGPEQRLIALDGKTLRHSFDNFNDRIQ